MRRRHEHVRGRQLGDVLERRARRQREPECEHLVEGDRIELAADARHLEQRLDLGGESDGSVTHCVVDRPHAGTVARQNQALTACVPDGKGKVAVERLDAVGAPLLVEMDDDLGVGRRLEHVAAGDQLGTQLDVVEDLAVKGDPDGAVLVAHRLLAAVEIDDAEARVGEADVAVDESAIAVRTAMRQRSDHARQQSAARLGRHRQSIVAGNTAHVGDAPLTQTLRR